MVRVPTGRPPTHPGEMLLEEFLSPLRMTQIDLAQRIDVPFQKINNLTNGRHSVTPDLALRLARVFGTSPDSWMNHQLRWDLYHMQQESKACNKNPRPNRGESNLSRKGSPIPHSTRRAGSRLPSTP